MLSLLPRLPNYFPTLHSFPVLFTVYCQVFQWRKEKGKKIAQQAPLNCLLLLCSSYKSSWIQKDELLDDRCKDLGLKTWTKSFIMSTNWEMSWTAFAQVHPRQSESHSLPADESIYLIMHRCFFHGCISFWSEFFLLCKLNLVQGC